MAEAALDQVDVLMIDPDRNAQSVLRTILGNSGFRNFQVGRSIEEMRSRVDETIPDLLISECELPDGDFCDFVSSLRHHELGRNPFVSIIALTQAPNPDTVTRISNSGVDHLVVKPFSTAQIVDRILALMKSRKLFVVTSDYIGPDRRGDSKRKNSVARIAVPNTLKAKALGNVSPEDIQKAIDITLAEVNLQKLERYDDEIVFLVDHILPALEGSRVDDTARQYMERLLFVAGDTGRRLTGTKYAHVSELCEALRTVSGSVFESLERPDSRDVQLLRPLSQAIRVGFGTNEETVAAAHEISTEALAWFRKAQEEKTTGTPRRRSTDIAHEEERPRAAEKTTSWVTKPTPNGPSSQSPGRVTSPAETAEARERGTPAEQAHLEGSFETVFVESLCSFVRQRLTPWHTGVTKPGPLPFVLSDAFYDRFEDAIRRHAAHAIPRNRRMVVLSQSLGRNDISEGVFHPLFNEPNAKDNVPRFLWNNWWDDIRSALRRDAEAPIADDVVDQDARQIWTLFQDDTAAGRYDPPRLEDIAFFKALFDYSTDGIGNGMTGLQQVLQHEATGDAQEGASRNFILAQIENQPPYFGDLLALWAFFTRRDFTPAIQKSLVASTGRTPAERRLVLPFYLRWAPDLTRRSAAG